MGLLYIAWAAWERDHGRDPGPLLARAFEAWKRTIAINPGSPRNRVRPANILRVQAEYEQARGEDPEPTAREMIKRCEDALSVNPRYPLALEEMAYAQLILGLRALERKQDPTPMVQAGREWARKFAESGSEVPGHVLDARLSLLLARWRLAKGLSAAAALQQAERAAAEAVRKRTHAAEGHVVTAEIQWWLARAHRGQGAVVARHAARGLAAVEQALSAQPAHGRALALRGALLLEQAAGGPGQAAARTRAKASLEQALAVNRFLAREFGSLLPRARA
jgi:eukaryotic-like serine/threonine-protein kinase